MFIETQFDIHIVVGVFGFATFNYNICIYMYICTFILFTSVYIYIVFNSLMQVITYF